MQITRRGVGRFLIAVACGTVVGVAFSNLLMFIQLKVANAPLPPGFWWMQLIRIGLIGIPMTALTCATSVMAFIFILRPKYDRECRCRQCSYILKGLSTLECPECGEAI